MSSSSASSATASKARRFPLGTLKVTEFMYGDGDYHCLNDGHPFHGKPYTHPVDETGKASGDIFCSTHCALRHVIDTRPPKLVPICHMFFLQHYGVAFTIPAPQRRTLKVHKGVYSIEQYRSMGTNKVYCVISPEDVFPFGIDARMVNEEQVEDPDASDVNPSAHA